MNLSSPKFLQLLIVKLIKKTDDQTFLIIVGSLIGVCGGFAAVILQKTVHLTFHILNGISIPDYLKFFIPAIGILLTVFYMKFVSREVPGHGIPDVIYAIARNHGVIKAKLMISRVITATLTVGFGGSVGLEGPIVVTGSAIGSNIGRYLRLNERRKSILIGCGTAAGIAGIFNAPIAGLTFALEVVLGEFAPTAFIPIVISAVCATEVGRIFLGDKVAFVHTPFIINSYELILFVILGIICGFFSISFSKAIYKVEKFFKELNFNVFVKALIGGMILGILGVIFPSTLGEGYDSIIQSLLQQNVSAVLISDLENSITAFFGDPILIISAIFLLKILATTVTLGCGGSGGVFAPSLTLGCLIGYIFSHGINLITQTHGYFVDEGSLTPLIETNYSLAAMTGILAGALHSPLTSIFLIFEITGGYDAILPLMIVSTISYVVSKHFEPESLYTKHLAEQGNLIRKSTDIGVLSKIEIKDIIEKNYKLASPEMTLGELVEVVKVSKRNFFPVINPKNREFYGIVFLDQIKEKMFESELYDKILVKDIMETDLEVVNIGERMENIMKKFEITDAWSLPVLDENRFVGMLSKSTIFFKYRNELILQNKS